MCGEWNKIKEYVCRQCLWHPVNFCIKYNHPSIHQHKEYQHYIVFALHVNVCKFTIACVHLTLDYLKHGTL